MQKTRRFTLAGTMPRPGKLLTICYGVAVILWAMLCVVHTALMLNYRLRGEMPTLIYTAQDLEYSSMGLWQHEGMQEPAAGTAWYDTQDRDPQFFIQGTMYVETVRLHAQYVKPAGTVELYYLRPGQTDYTERQKVYATMTAQNEYTFDLGGRVVSALRIDPDNQGANLILVENVHVNPVTPWYLRVVPSAGWCLVLLFAPPLAAALLASLWRKD